MKTISLAFPEADFERFENWCKVHRLKRNSAVMALLDIAEKSTVLRTPSVEPEDSGQGSSLPGKTLELDRKLLKMSLGKKVLEYAQEYTGVAPVSLEGEELVKGDPVPTALESFYKNKESTIVPEKRPVTWDEFNQDDQ